jgi:hypothetical protein
VVAGLRAGVELREQPGLPGARLTAQSQPAAARGAQRIQRSLKASS